jgi:hypothetical protein
LGSTTSTSQPVKPFQCAMGGARKLNLWPTMGCKFILHQPLLDQRASAEARQIFSGGCGISRSTTRERVAAGLVIDASHSTGFETVETVAPEGAIETHPVDERHQTLRLGAVVDAASFRSIANQAGELQHAQVLGHRGLRHAGAIRQGADGLLAVADQALEDRSTGRVGKGLENLFRRSVHVGIITVRLWISQGRDPATSLIMAPPRRRHTMASSAGPVALFDHRIACMTLAPTGSMASMNVASSAVAGALNRREGGPFSQILP